MAGERSLPPELIADIVAELPVREIAVAVSEPARRWRIGLVALAMCAGNPARVIGAAGDAAESKAEPPPLSAID